MTEQDRAAKKTEEIVSEWRNRGTPIDERLARLVASELRKAYEEIERLRRDYNHDHQLCIDQSDIVFEANHECNQMRAEIARLRAELAKAKP